MSAPAPAPAELAIPRVLWRGGASTVRDVHKGVYADTETGYTSALKIMQNMLVKGLVRRTDGARQRVLGRRRLAAGRRMDLMPARRCGCPRRRWRPSRRVHRPTTTAA